MRAVAVLLAGILCGGCIHVVKPQVTSIPYDAGSMELAGPVYGECKRMTILGILPIEMDGDFSTKIAEEKALLPVRGQFILNPMVDVDYNGIPGVFQVQTIRISGTAAKFKGRGGVSFTPAGQDKDSAQPYESHRAADGTLVVRPNP